MVFCLFKRIHKKDQWNRIEGPEIDPHAIVNRSLTEAKGNMIVFSTNDVGMIGHHMLKKGI